MLEVADDVLLDEVLQPALVDVVHDRRREREQLRGQSFHLLGDLEALDPVADQRLVDVQVEELDLRVGDPRQRLPVDADELQEGHEREAGRQHGRHVAQQPDVVLEISSSAPG